MDDSFHIYLGGGYNYYSLHLVSDLKENSFFLSFFFKTLLRIVWMILSSDVSVKSRITADSSSKLKWEVHSQICIRFSTSSRICISPSDSFFLEGLERWDSAERPFVTCVSHIYDVE